VATSRYKDVIEFLSACSYSEEILITEIAAVFWQSEAGNINLRNGFCRYVLFATFGISFVSLTYCIDQSPS